MASTIFDVTPEELEASATKLEDKSAEFTKAYKNIYTAAADLKVSYKGESSEEFNKQIESYKENFINGEKVLKEYIQFVRDYAKLLKKSEEELKNAASSLA